MSHLKRPILLENTPQYDMLLQVLGEQHVTSLLLVCGNSMTQMERPWRFFQQLPEHGITVTRFSQFSPNPEVQAVERGKKVLRKEGSTAICAVGGGSALDVAKGIRIATDTPLLVAIPTTAGSGSEATPYAVLYRDGQKESIAQDGCVPDYVLLDPSVLNTLPLYQRKATMLDALCHCVESMWSVHATPASWALSREGIQLFWQHYRGYLANILADNVGMQQAAFLGGQAIAITQTTAAHAMSYQLTMRYGISHGHAAGLCLLPVWKQLAQRCVAPEALKQLCDAFAVSSIAEAIKRYEKLLHELALETPKATDDELWALACSANPVRLRNHPISLTEQELLDLYREALQTAAAKE